MMKYLFIATIALVLLSAAGCKKTDDNCRCTGQYSGPMQVITDCTGSYLRYQQKDYKICNTGALIGFNSGDLVNASFNKTTCTKQPGFICQMFHENEGFITIACIQKPVFEPHEN